MSRIFRSHYILPQLATKLFFSTKLPLIGGLALRGWYQNDEIDETYQTIEYRDFRFRSIFKYSLSKVNFRLSAVLEQKRC